jgi:hypothetical protein
VSIANEDTGQLVLTTPPQSSLGDNIALTLSLAFSATPTTGTAYTMANAGGNFSVHGTLDATMPGDASAPSGNVAGTTTLHLTF